MSPVGNAADLAGSRRLAQVYIDGAWEEAAGTDRWELVDPATEVVLAEARGAATAQVDAAVNAASRAAAAWARTPMVDRAARVAEVGQRIASARGVLATALTAELGVPVATCASQHVDPASRIFLRTAEISSAIVPVEHLDSTEVRPVPLGVAACITPWNYPLYLAACKLAPALVAGCPVILKPSELAPRSVLAMAEIIADCGLPAGVFNLVTGSGAEVGRRLVGAPSVDVVSFTGSTATGRLIAALAGEGPRRVLLELGGKSAVIVLEDGDLAAAVQAAVAKCMQNSGQTCAAFTRLIVPAARLAQTERLAAEFAIGFRAGDPWSDKTTLGPVASAVQYRKVLALIESAIAEGARAVTGGLDRPEYLARGYFVAPTVLSGVRPHFRVAREEVFGPVLSILTYRDESEAMALAEASDFGLSVGVWAADSARAAELARQLRVGSASINGAPTHPDAPFGGFRASGFGRERGRAGIEEFLTTQALHFAPAAKR